MSSSAIIFQKMFKFETRLYPAKPVKMKRINSDIYWNASLALFVFAVINTLITVNTNLGHMKPHFFTPITKFFSDMLSYPVIPIIVRLNSEYVFPIYLVLQFLVCLLYGLIIERIISLVRKSEKIKSL